MSDSFSIVDGRLQFGRVSAGAKVKSQDTFILRRAVSTPFTLPELRQLLHWNITANAVPLANAGADQTVEAGDTEQLDGGGRNVSNADQVEASFVPDLVGTYVVQLILRDGQLGSDPDSAIITVERSSRPAPVITDISSTSASVGAELTITGSNLLPASGCPRVTLTDQSSHTINAPVIRCTATSIVFVVPAGAGTGPIMVTIDG